MAFSGASQRICSGPASSIPKGEVTFQTVLDQAYGIMRATLSWSASVTIMLLPSLRLVLGSLEVRMCLTLVWWRLILPVPVLEKRLAAPVWVFSLGIVFSILPADCESPGHFRTTLGTEKPLLQGGPNQYIAGWILALSILPQIVCRT